MDQYAVFGNPISHSLSPRIHTLFARMTGVSLEYDKILVPLEYFSETVFQFARSGGKGANVTVPFKLKALSIASHQTDRAQLAGAANTLKFIQTGQQQNSAHNWSADNTDGAGLVRDITCNAGIDLKNKQVLLIGAGGASSGVLGALIEAKPKSITVTNRTLHKAQDLVSKHRAFALLHQVELHFCDLYTCQTGYDVVINGTASSLLGENIPVPSSVLKPGAMAIDMMYGAPAQNFMQWAKQHGAHARDGLGMLVEQAAEAFYFWHAVRPDGASVLKKLAHEL